MTDNKTARSTIAYLIVRDQAHENAFAKALESLGVNWGKLLPIPKTNAEQFPEVKKLLDKGLQSIQYTFSADDQSQAAKLYRGASPSNDGTELSTAVMPEGVPITIAPERREEFSPGLDTELLVADPGDGRDRDEDGRQDGHHRLHVTEPPPHPGPRRRLGVRRGPGAAAGSRGRCSGSRWPASSTRRCSTSCCTGTTSTTARPPRPGWSPTASSTRSASSRRWPACSCWPSCAGGTRPGLAPLGGRGAGRGRRVPALRRDHPAQADGRCTRSATGSTCSRTTWPGSSSPSP